MSRFAAKVLRALAVVASNLIGIVHEAVAVGSYKARAERV